MLSGVKFIPRDQIDEAQDKNSNAKRKKSNRSKKDKHQIRKKSSKYSSSDDDLDKIKKGSRKSTKWYSSEEYSSSSYSTGSESDEEERQIRKKSKRNKGRKHHSAEDFSSSTSDDDHRNYAGKDRRKRTKETQCGKGIVEDDLSEGDEGSLSREDLEITRKEMGLDWMLKPGQMNQMIDRKPTVSVENEPEETPAEEIKRVNPREMNPYFRNNGSGYPDEADGKNTEGHQLLPTSVVGDGGASWRLKALKRAREQAAREGRNFEEIVEERWGSVGQLALSTMSTEAAPSRAHLRAIRNRQRGQSEEHQMAADDENGRDIKKNSRRDYLNDVSTRHPEMRAPQIRNSLSWGKRKSQPASSKDADLISAAVSSLNKFQNDGSFMEEFHRKQSKGHGRSLDSSMNSEEDVETKIFSSEANKPGEVDTEGLSANQLAAKAMQLRIKGKHEEAENLLQKVQSMKSKERSEDNSVRHRNVENTSRHVVQDFSVQKKKEEDADLHLARTIMHNKQYSISGRADDEYDYEDGPRRKSRKKGSNADHKTSENNFAKRILTQQERCLFCFENPNRPRHLVVSIANFTYLMLPQYQSVVPGHCCILPMQHESATRTVDNTVWEEIRNFKKCLIMMFAKQEKELVFLETVMGLSQQRRHCLIECIPLPREIAKQAPVYFKKAIDEAEDEWSQHNAKKLIDTSEKGLRGSIPKNFPYFHVEFGLNKGFVHVIDDETQFKSSIGLNVIRGMMRLPEEDMYRRRRQESVEAQRQAVASFSQEWEPFDWTKQLD